MQWYVGFWTTAVSGSRVFTVTEKSESVVSAVVCRISRIAHYWLYTPKQIHLSGFPSPHHNPKQAAQAPAQRRKMSSVTVHHIKVPSMSQFPDQSEYQILRDDRNPIGTPDREPLPRCKKSF